eukprot:1158595-Pelagomonas_calceolata.AAC.3
MHQEHSRSATYARRIRQNTCIKNAAGRPLTWVPEKYSRSAAHACGVLDATCLQPGNQRLHIGHAHTEMSVASSMLQRRRNTGDHNSAGEGGRITGMSEGYRGASVD